ncbi:MAG: hypothetical protein KF767_18450 [Bdellovibrionaceae bacterium]|nr:hypothetical protein [Pseudobdellovibrionaceae bacterium]
MADLVYVLCGVTCVACAVLLFRAYRRTGTQLLMWSALCFGLFALNNSVLVMDVVVFPERDFQGLLWRNALGSGAGAVLLFGLIWELT